MPLPLARASATSVVQICDLDSVRPLWDQLIAHCEHPTPMQDWQWLSTWWDCFGKRCPVSGATGHLKILVVYADDIPIGIFPLFSREYGRFSLQIRKLHGIGHAGPLDPATLAEEPAALIRIGCADQAIQAAVRHLELGLKKGSWDAYTLEALVSPSQAGKDLAIKAIGIKPIRFRNKVCSKIVALPESWDSFRRMLSKSMRDNIAYYPKRLAKDGYGTTIRVARTPAEVALAMGSLIELHRLRATAGRSNHENYFRSSQNARYFTEVHRRLAEEGKAFIGILEIDGRPAAAQSFFQLGDELVLGYSGFDPKFGRYSPLFILQIEVLKHVVGSGVRRLNLLKGNAPWQTRWRPEAHRNVVTVVSYSMRPMALLRVVLYTLRREIELLSRRGVSLKVRERSPVLPRHRPQTAGG